MRIALYLRQSKDRTGEADGVDRQRADCTSVIKARWPDAEVVEFIDNDVSATKSKPRPRFTEMMHQVDNGDFKIVMSRHMDRLLRKLSEFVSVRDRCIASNTWIITANDGVDTSTDGGRLVAGILAMVAEQEMVRKSERHKSAISQAAARGKRVGGPRPFGYQADGITINDREAPIVIQGYVDILAGENLSSLTRKWNEMSQTTRGKPWTRQSVRQVLTNPRYAGLRRHRAQEDRGSKDPRLGIVGEAEWPALVEESMWSAATRILSNPAKQHVRADQAFLSGVALCGVCGAPMGRGTKTSAGSPTYRCSAKSCVMQRSDPIDLHIAVAVVNRLTMPDASTLWVAEGVDTKGLMAEAADLRAELAALDEDRMEGRLDRTRWRTMNERVQARLSAVQSDLDRAGDTSPLAIVGSADVRATWASYSMQRQRAVVAALMAPVIHSPGMGARKFKGSTIDLGWHDFARPPDLPADA